jgi:nitroreductase
VSDAAADRIDFLRTMRAVRRYADRPVPDDALADVLEVARWTGSAKNRQPWELVVVEDRATLQALSTSGDFAGHLAGAPLGLVLLMTAEGPGVRTTGLDEGRLAQNLMLAAWAHGLGSCIATVWSDREAAAKEVVGAPPDRTLRTILSVGYPEDAQARFLSAGPGRPAIPVGRKGLDEVVSYERHGRRTRRPDAAASP